MISKELLSEVTSHNVTSVNCVKNNTLRYFVSNEFYNTLNIYELAHKCKEWAKNNGYVIGTDLDRVNVWSIKDRKIVNNFEVYWEDYTEYEIKACEWILKEQNEK